MRRAILATSCLILTAFGQGCGDKSVFPTRLADFPDIQFEERIYDFGIAGQQEKIIHDYRFMNVGKRPLIIETVKTSCGCIASLISSKEVAPGTTGVIDVNFETGKRRGQQRENIYVRSNDPDEPEIELEIRGMIRTEAAVQPESLYFGDVERGKTVAKAVKLIQIDEGQLDLHRVEVPEEYFTTSVSGFEDERHRGFNIDVVLRPDAPIGRFTEAITLHTNLKKHPRIDVPICGNVLGRIRVRPQMASLGTLIKGSPPANRIEVTSVDQKAFDILKVTSNPPFFSTEVVRGKTNCAFEIILKVKEDAPAGRVAGEIHIHTDDLYQPLIKVPVYGLIAK